MKSKAPMILFTAGIVLAALVATGVAAEKIKIEKLDDLPRHTYRIEGKAAEIISDDAAVRKLAAEVKADLLADLDKYDIPDQTTVLNYYSNLATIALIEGDFDGYETLIERVRELEDKEAQKLTTGMTGRSYVAAMRALEGERQEAYRAAYAAQVNSLPYAVVEPQLKQVKGSAEMLSENLLVGMMESRFQPMIDQTGGEIGKDVALSMLGSASLVRTFLPYKENVVAVIDQFLAAHAVTKEDIWAEREVVFDGTERAKLVTIAVWDSGLDTENPEIQKNLWTNDGEIPGNRQDDDRNGWVDDYHGIAFTLHSEKTPDLLYPVGDVGKDRGQLQGQMKGLIDIGMAVESEEATAVKQTLGSLQQAEAQPFIENVSLYGNFCHGTHVAGIALAGNPYVRVMAARITFGHTLLPEKPTVEQARKDSVAMAETINYFKEHGVRVVNMSWGGSLADVEAALEAHNEGGTPEERKALAREIFEIGRGALYEGIKNTPEILYVTSAGNEDNDVKFEEVIPSDFDLENIMVVGAVDQAGDETGFTSFGNVDCYANGYEVESFVPGGDRMKLSGTSQASPQVTNLAAKILALQSHLNPTEVKDLILQGCEERQTGERTVRLINPKRTIASVKQM